MKSRGSDNEEEDWDSVVLLTSLKNAKLNEKDALELEDMKREVLEGNGIGKDEKDKEEASPEDKDNEVTATVEGREADAALILESLANAMLDEKTASELKKRKRGFLKDRGKVDVGPSSDIHGRNYVSGQKQRYSSLIVVSVWMFGHSLTIYKLNLVLLSHQGKVATTTNQVCQMIK